MPENNHNYRQLSSTTASLAGASLDGVSTMRANKLTASLLSATLLVMGIGAAGCTTTHYAQAQTQKGVLPTPVKFDCSGSVKIPEVEQLIYATYPDGPTRKEPLGACYGAADLNQKGKPEILVVLQSLYFSGPGGMPFYAFTQDSGKWTMLADGSSSVFAIKVDAASSNGYNNLTALKEDGTPAYQYKYNGTKYAPVVK